MPAIVGFDITISVKESSEDYLKIIAVLITVFKKWVFQREVGEKTGYDHWQVRGHLWKPTTPECAVAKFAHLTWKGKWSPTTKGVHQGNNFNYMMKADTRVDGPWTSEDEEIVDPPKLTRQLKTFMNFEMYPYQKQLIEEVQELEDRYIKLVIEKTGNNGKSIFCEYLEYKRLAYEIPPMSCMEDIMQCCMCIKEQKCYVIDMPRAMKKDKLAGFYSGLEALKNGTMYDKRHHFDKRRIDRPQILVFTNRFPDIELMSLDRWKIWELNELKQLVFRPVI